MGHPESAPSGRTDIPRRGDLRCPSNAAIRIQLGREQVFEGEDRPVESTSEFGGLGLVQSDEENRFHGDDPVDIDVWSSQTNEGTGFRSALFNGQGWHERLEAENAKDRPAPGRATRQVERQPMSHLPICQDFTASNG
jgi:hypothetical protein